MTNRRFSFIKLDLDLLVTRTDFEKFMDFHSIPKGAIDIDYFLEERKWSKIWILDPITFNGICWIDRSCPDGILWLPDFSEEVEFLPSYDPSSETNDMNIDSILDKISKVGIQGLTKIEKQFLDNQSKG